MMSEWQATILCLKRIKSGIVPLELAPVAEVFATFWTNCRLSNRPNEQVYYTPIMANRQREYNNNDRQNNARTVSLQIHNSYRSNFGQIAVN